MDSENRYRRYNRPSFFFPIALITVGVVWLLVQNSTIPVENVYRLLPFWPVLLILAGISILLRRIWWPLNALLWAGTAGLVIWALIAPPAFLPAVSPAEIRHQVLREPLGQARSANVQLGLSINSTTIHPLSGSQDLLVADIYSSSERVLDASGSEQKNISLKDTFTPDNFVFNFRPDQWLEVSSKSWDIGLTPAIPLKLTVNASTGSTNLNLSGLKLDSLNVDGSTGSMDITLPENSVSLPFDLHASTGSITMTVPNTQVDMAINASTGSITINTPSGSGVQVDLRDASVGSFSLPSDFKKVSGSGNDKEGVYENSAYAGAKAPIRIRLNMSTGSFTLR